MNTVSSDRILSPNGVLDTVSKIVVDTLPAVFKFHSITRADKQYTLSFNAKTSGTKTVTINGTEVELTADWTHHELSFTATGNDLAYEFATVGTYYFHNSQLEVGNKASDYTQAPEDISVEQILVDGTKQIDGTKIADDSIYSSSIAPLQIMTKHLTANCVTSEKIVANAITADKIAAHTITANELAVGTITAESAIIASIDAEKITTGTLDVDRLNLREIFAKDITATGSLKYSYEVTENNVKKSTELLIDKDNFKYGKYEENTKVASSSSVVATLTDHLEIESRINDNLSSKVTLDATNGLQFENGAVGYGTAKYQRESATFEKNGKVTTINGLGISTDMLTATIVKAGSGQIEGTSQHMILKPSPTESDYFFHLGLWETGWRFSPTIDSQVALGHANHRWTTVYAQYGVSQTSDEREKNIIGELDDRYINLLKELKPILYRWKANDDGIYFGLGAQTTQALMNKNDIQGTMVQEENGRFSINYAQVIPLLIKAVQDIYSKIA